MAGKWLYFHFLKVNLRTELRPCRQSWLSDFCVRWHDHQKPDQRTLWRRHPRHMSGGISESVCLTRYVRQLSIYVNHTEYRWTVTISTSHSIVALPQSGAHCPWTVVWLSSPAYSDEARYRPNCLTSHKLNTLTTLHRNVHPIHLWHTGTIQFSFDWWVEKNKFNIQKLCYVVTATKTTSTSNKVLHCYIFFLYNKLQMYGWLGHSLCRLLDVSHCTFQPH